MKFTLHLLPINGRPFSGAPARTVELDGERISIQEHGLPDFPWKRKYVGRRMSLWVVGNEFGALGAVVAPDVQDALDGLVDAGLAGGLAIDQETAEKYPEDVSYLGNADEPHDLANAWMQRVGFELPRDIVLVTALERADAAGENTLAHQE